MDMLKRVLAVLGATFGSLALFYFVFKPVCRTRLVKENGIACDMGKLGNMRKGVKVAICANPLKNGRVGTVPRNLKWVAPSLVTQ